MLVCENLRACGQEDGAVLVAGGGTKSESTGTAACPLLAPPQATAQLLSGPWDSLFSTPSFLCSQKAFPNCTPHALSLAFQTLPGLFLASVPAMHQMHRAPRRSRNSPSTTSPPCSCHFFCLGCSSLLCPRKGSFSRAHPAASPSGRQGGGCQCVWEPGACVPHADVSSPDPG